MKSYQFHWRAMAGFQLGWFLLVYFQHSAILPVLVYWLFALLRLPTHRHRFMVLLIMLCGLVIDGISERWRV